MWAPGLANYASRKYSYEEEKGVVCSSCEMRMPANDGEFFTRRDVGMYLYYDRADDGSNILFVKYCRAIEDADKKYSCLLCLKKKNSKKFDEIKRCMAGVAFLFVSVDDENFSAEEDQQEQ
jgi:hypothetical protein